MTQSTHEPIPVVVAMDFSDALIDELRSVSPRFQIERHFPTVPEKAWARAEILYTATRFPEPGQAPNLRWIQLHSAGIDHMVRQPVMSDDNITITTTSGMHAPQMAEYCLTMILAFHYRLLTLLKYQARGEWRTKTDGGDALYAPRDLRRKTVGIAGYGSIGRELARLADALGMRVLASKRDLMTLDDDAGYMPPGKGDPHADIPDRLYPAEALASLAQESDYLVLTLPLTNGTRHCVNKEVLNAMKPGAVLINVGRGALVDEKALADALKSKKLGGAALDVFEQEPLPPDSPLWKLENVILTPHISGNSAEYHDKAVAIFVENLQRYLESRPLLNRVNRNHGY